MFVDNSSFSTKSFKSDYVLSVFYGNIRLMINPNPRLAHEANAPIAAINIGETRADSILSLKINARCGEVSPPYF